MRLLITIDFSHTFAKTNLQKIEPNLLFLGIYVEHY